MESSSESSRMAKAGPYVAVFGWLCFLLTVAALVQPEGRQPALLGVPASAWACVAGTVAYVAGLLSFLRGENPRRAFRWFSPYLFGVAAAFLAEVASRTPAG